MSSFFFLQLSHKVLDKKDQLNTGASIVLHITRLHQVITLHVEANGGGYLYGLVRDQVCDDNQGTLILLIENKWKNNPKKTDHYQGEYFESLSLNRVQPNDKINIIENKDNVPEMSEKDEKKKQLMKSKAKKKEKNQAQNAVTKAEERATEETTEETTEKDKSNKKQKKQRQHHYINI
jgi:hypothetical protein